MLRPSPNHGTQRLPDDDDDGPLVDNEHVGQIRSPIARVRARRCLYYVGPCMFIGDKVVSCSFHVFSM